MKLLLTDLGMACAMAFFVTLAVTGALAYAGLIEGVVARSSHTKPTPSAGGLGVLAGFAAGIIALSYSFIGVAAPREFAQLLALIMGMGALGLLDDVTDVNAGLKMMLIMVISIFAVWVIGPPHRFYFFGTVLLIPEWFGYFGAILWVFVVSNAVNFMDGINGMMVLSMIIGHFGICVLALLSGSIFPLLFSALVLAALLGFLPYNFKSKADIFSGDVGSLAIGFSFAISALVLVRQTDGLMLFAVPLLVLPFLTDVFLTLFGRARRGEPLMQAHRKHLYQLAVIGGRSHLTVSYVYAYAAMVCLATALIAFRYGWLGSPLPLIISVILAVALHRAVLNSRVSKKSPKP